MPVTELAKVKTAIPAEIEAGALAHLAQHAAAARGAYAGNTERALRADVTIFTAWCSDAGATALPAAAATVAAFIDAMAALKAPATVRRYVSSIATFHRAAGVANPCETQPVKLALKRMHRERGRAQAQAAPVNDVLVARMLAAAGDTLRHRRNRALLAVAYSTLCRRSELVALRCADLQVDAEGFGTITIRRSKTDQEGFGDVAPIAADAMRHLAGWIQAAGVTDGTLFRAVLKGGRVGDALDSGDVARIFKAMAQAAKLTAEEIARISGHSTRVGAAQDMVRYGVDLVGAMQAGRWKTSAMVARYSARLLAKRGGMAQIADRRVQF
jgi:site-specific recombinase XerD